MSAQPQHFAVTSQPRLLNIASAASYLSATPWFIRSQIWSGSLPYLKLGKRYLFDRADLDAFITRQKIAAQS